MPGPADSKIRSKLLNLWPYWFAIVFTVMFHFPLLVHGWGMSGAGDFTHIHIPNRMLQSMRFQEGDLPQWTDAIFCGYPVLADPQSAFFYPQNLLWGWLFPHPDTQAIMNVYVLVILLGVAVSTTFLARSAGVSRTGAVVASLVISYCGFIIQHINHVNMLQALSAGLFSLGFLLRIVRNPSGRNHLQFSLASGLWMAVAILAGHPQMNLFIAYCGVVTFVVFAIRWTLSERRWGAVARLTGWCVLAAAVAAGASVVQLLPTADLLRVCARMSMHMDHAFSESARADELLSLLFPGLYRELPWRFAVTDIYTKSWFQWLRTDWLEAGYWVGYTGLALATGAWIVWWRRWSVQFLFIGAGLMVVCALGDEGRLYSILYHWLPGFNAVRVPSRLMCIAFVGWGLLAGMFVDALLHSPGDFKVVRSCRITAALSLIVFFLCATAFAWMFTHPSERFALLQNVLVRVKEYKDVVAAQPDAFVRAVTRQLVFGSLFAATVNMALIFAARARSTRRAAWCVGLLILVLVSELTIYGFGLPYAKVQHPYTEVRYNGHEVLKRPARGRMNVSHSLQGGGVMNAAMVQGLRLSSGYSATVPEWNEAISPSHSAPWRAGLDGKLMDLSNVTDVLAVRHMKQADISGQRLRLEDWGYLRLMQEDPLASREYTLSSGTTAPVSRLHILCSASNVIELPDGTDVGQVAGRSAKGDVVLSRTLLLGRDTSDWWYDALDENTTIAHRRAAGAFRRTWGLGNFQNGDTLFNATVEVDPPLPISTLTVAASGPTSVSLILSHVITVTSSGMKIGTPSQTEGCREVRSSDGSWHHWTRPDAPGFSWMIPTAELASYRKMQNVLSRIAKPEFDIKRGLYVSSQKYSTEELNEWNALWPQAFKGKSKLQWSEVPEAFSVTTDSDQPGWTFVSSTWYPGWLAQLDGKPVEVAQANGAFMAVSTPAGKHQIKFRYRTPRLLVAGCASAFTWLIAVGLISAGLGRRSKRRDPHPHP